MAAGASRELLSSKGDPDVGFTSGADLTLQTAMELNEPRGGVRIDEYCLAHTALRNIPLDVEWNASRPRKNCNGPFGIIGEDLADEDLDGVWW